MQGGNFTTIGPKLAEKIGTKESDDSLKYLTSSETYTPLYFEFNQSAQKL